MPCLDVTLPRTAPDIKHALIRRLTDAVVAAGFERDIFRVFIREYDGGEAGLAGVPWGGEGQPPLHLILYCPRQSRAVKRALIRNLSRAFVEATGHADWLPVIHICEHPYDNIGVDGEMLSEIPELAQRKFYYPLPTD